MTDATYGWMRGGRRKSVEEEPYKRTGLCCGPRCLARRSRPDVVLYRVARSRYRCRDCFRKEAGFYP